MRFVSGQRKDRATLGKNRSRHTGSSSTIWDTNCGRHKRQRNVFQRTQIGRGERGGGLGRQAGVAAGRQLSMACK